MDNTGTRRAVASFFLPLAVALAFTLALSPGRAGTALAGDVERSADEHASVVDVFVLDTAELDRLVATGVDLDHGVDWIDGRFRVRAVISPSEAAALQEKGFILGAVAFDHQDSMDRVLERNATIALHVQANEAFAAAAYDESTPFDVSDVRIIRADYYTSFGQQYLSVEAKWAGAQAGTDPLVVERDSGPDTAFGSGGTQQLSPFVDAGVYLYHRGAAAVSTRPSRIRITSPTGDVAIAQVNDWLLAPGESIEDAAYLKDFVTSYLTPTELYERIHLLAAEFPELAEVVELPYPTNGYRRKAQALLGSTSATRVGVDSRAWGHEGGNDVTIAAVDPGRPNSPLTVSVSGTDITVSLATDFFGGLATTAAEVVAALNASPAASSLVFAYTFRGNAGAGIVAESARIGLSDFLSAPGNVSRDPHAVYALRIGKYRDGSRPGVLAYAQEHAREWVPPLVAIETAERLVRNYAHSGRTKQLLNNLEVWIAPSINPDGAHYSFFDENFQRKNMTRYCPVTGFFDLLSRDFWGVDNNRNYDQYSLFDGYFGASTDCTDDVFAGPGELSEPENQNLAWIVSTNANIRFAMNLHSSGNFFMWSPGSYIEAGRITAPRPTLEQESFFWGASARMLTAIKAHRGLSVTPARTGPISDVLYSAAGNSGDMLWYRHGIYAWNFEVGTEFQPPFAAATPAAPSAHEEAMEFSNGLVELVKLAYDYGKDSVRPESYVHFGPSSTLGMVSASFTTSEPAAVFYSLDGSTPTYASKLYASAGVREGGERLTIPGGTVVKWFSVDSAGNVERNYRPDGRSKNFSKAVAPAN
jgi:hypothetical protein